ncbi:MAG: hypothetical protein M3P06_11560 [Acidobacteriota bacterium]|nr:hypothetical protein [Acidobacteriota bacterium]
MTAKSFTSTGFFNPLAKVPDWIKPCPVDAYTLRKFIIDTAVTINEENGTAIDAVPLADLTRFYEIITGRPFYVGGRVNQ